MRGSTHSLLKDRAPTRPLWELLRHARVQAPRPSPVPDAGRSPDGDLRIHRRLVQPATPPLRPRLPVPHQLREEPVAAEL